MLSHVKEEKKIEYTLYVIFENRAGVLYIWLKADVRGIYPIHNSLWGSSL